MSQFVASEKRSYLAVALAGGATIAAAAEQCGVSRRTVERKLAQPKFRQLVADLRGQLVASALGRMADNMSRAADAMAALLDAEQPGLRLRAARAVVTLGLRLRDAVDLTDRVRELEQELARKQGDL